MSGRDEDRASPAQRMREQFKQDLARLGELNARLRSPVSTRQPQDGGGASRNTVHRWLKGQSFPDDVEQLVKLVNSIRAAAECGRESGTPQKADDALLAPQWWRDRHQEVQRVELEEGEALRRARQAESDVASAQIRTLRAALSDRLVPLATATAERLGVHPAITGVGAGSTDGTRGTDFVLPEFFRRPHDGRLDSAVAAAAGGEETVLAVVRGGSCSGKTRSLTEAIIGCAGLDGWQLCRGRSVAGILQALAPGVLPGRTVLWLDDFHEQLRDARGEELAAALLSRLAHPGPLLIAVTLWDSEADILTLRPDAELPDPHRHARALLTGATATVQVPHTLDPGERGRLSATRDPSLREALRLSRDGMVMQTLAAGLQLADGYETDGRGQAPARFAWAVLTAAMDAFRLGWNAPLPEAFLEQAAPGYLTDQERAGAPADWFTTALARTCRPVLRAAAALEPVPRSTGMGSQPGLWLLTDYLDAYGRTTRSLHAPPHLFWDAAARNATLPDHLSALEKAARTRLRLVAADRLRDLAAAAGHPEANGDLARLRAEAGDFEGAERYARRAADAGNPYAYGVLASLLAQAGEAGTAERLARRVAGGGNPYGYGFLANWWADTGDFEEAERLARLATDAGHPFALGVVAVGMAQHDDFAGAERLARLTAEAGQPDAFGAVAGLWTLAGGFAAAEPLARLAAAAGNTDGYAMLAAVRAQTGGFVEAERFARLSADAGNPQAFSVVARMRAVSGDVEEAERLARAAVDAGDPRGYGVLTQLRIGAGDFEEAERLAHLAALAGHAGAYGDLSKSRAETGDFEEAERLARLAAAAGDFLSYSDLARSRSKAGDFAEGERFAGLAAAGGSPRAYRAVAALRAKSGDFEEAERLAGLAAAAGDSYAYSDLPWRRAADGDGGRADSADVCLDAGHPYSWLPPD